MSCWLTEEVSGKVLRSALILIYSVLQKPNWSFYILVIIWKHGASKPLRPNRTFVFSAPWKIQTCARTADTAKKFGQIKIQEVWKVTLQESFVDLMISLLKCLQGFFFWPPTTKQTNKKDPTHQNPSMSYED